MNNNALLQAIALDLKRIAIGYHSGSTKMADRFLEEVGKRKVLLDYSSLQPTVKKLVINLDQLAKEKNIQKRADDALMYSTLFISYSKG